MSKWDGKTKGSLWGYRFFIFSINVFGITFSYFICFFVALYFLYFAKKQRNGLIQFYQLGFNYSLKKAKKLSFDCFYIFGQTLIDRIAFFTRHKKKYTHNFNNEKVLLEIVEQQKGGILLSAHLGNWETAANLLNTRVTNTINVLMMDSEVEKVKAFLNLKTGGPQFNLIPIKGDFSHVILIHQALKRNELIAIHADRVFDESKVIEVDFLGRKAKFPLGPFMIAHKFKVPITFVYAVKARKFHYELSATDPFVSEGTLEEIVEKYVKSLEKMVKLYPNQWFNFYSYYDN